MLSYDEALTRILAAADQPLPAEAVALDAAPGRALAEDIFAPTDLPLFDNSMMDGYAINGDGGSKDDITKPAEIFWPVVREIAAGQMPGPPLIPGTAARIFTGAPTPDGTTAVVMVEESEIRNDDPTQVLLHDAGSADFIRKRGSDITMGTLALRQGTTLAAGEIGLLAALNQAEVWCPRLPRIGLLTTGDELIPVGDQPLQAGQIRNSNGPALRAAVAEAGGTIAGCRHAADTPAAVAAAFHDLADCDVILSSGGVSVGDHDYVKAVVEEIGTLNFWRIQIRPGKPLAFGRVGSALFVGLPGNPASSLVTFELFVRPLVRTLAGHAQIHRSQVTAALAGPLAHAPGRREFVRATLRWEKHYWIATPLGQQTSHRLLSLAGADALVIVHESLGDLAGGEILPALLLR